MGRQNIKEIQTTLFKNNSHCVFRKLLSIILVISILVSMVSCSSSVPVSTVSEPTEKIIVEQVETENVLNETVYTEHITDETYLNELILAEETIKEYLLKEETIEEVFHCQTIYVSQNRIDDFAQNSRLADLLGQGVNLKELLTKIAVGTGVLVTVVVLKKKGFPDPVVSIVTAAADKSLQFSKSGAVIGSIFGGATGVTDAIDKSGRTSALVGFAMATAGLVVAIASLIGEIPSGGSTTVTLAAGLKLAIAGISTVAATAGEAASIHNVIKTLVTTDGFNINWNNIDWEKAGISTVEKAINYGADGYMWGALIGAAYGGIDGYEFYQKFHTPYTEYNLRISQTPQNGEKGHWSGERGESEFILDKPIELPNGKTVTKIAYKNGIPDFSPFQVAQVKVPKMTNKRIGTGGNYQQADQALAEYWNRIGYEKRIWTARDVEAYRIKNKLTWHEMSNMESMQLVPSEVNSTFGHCGGVAEYNAMIGQEGATVYD